MNTPETRTMDPEFLHMLKTGLSKEEFKVTEAQVAGYPKDFVQFMDLMIAEKKVKRNEIAARTGLSIGYLYKLLNGSRHTDDRDYIIAICFALHLNLAQAQHALRCNGSPLLSADDDRAAYIMRGLIYGLDLYKMNECLSRLNLCMIRVSQDMPKAPIKDSLFSIEKDPVLSDEDETDESDPSETAAARLPNIYDAPKMRHTYVEIESSAEAVHDGNAWFDFDVFGVMTVQDEDTDEIFHISAAYFAAGDSYFAVQTDEQYKEYVEQEEKYHKSAGNLHIEMYDDFSDVAAKSEFFPSFMQLDRLTDLKLEEALRKVDDTKNYGVRFGAHWMGGDSPEMYIEMFNDQEPEKQEYYQLIENREGKITYSASHESYFLRIDSGDTMYGMYYPNRPPMQFFLKTDNDGFDKLPMPKKMIFNVMRHILHTKNREMQFFFGETPDIPFYNEEVEFFSEQAVVCLNTDRYKEAKTCLRECNKCLDKCSLPKKEVELIRILNESKLMFIAFKQNNQKEYHRLEKSIINKADEMLQRENELGEYAPQIYTVIANAMHDKRRRLWESEKKMDYPGFYDKILVLIEHGALSGDENAIARFDIFQSYAFSIDQTDPEKAEGYYVKAITEATNHHLENDDDVFLSVPAIYNNYGWLLWNKLGSEEAIIYYGRAVELMEMYMATGKLPEDKAKERLAHYGKELYGIYKDTSKNKEMQRLISKFEKYGISLEE